MKSYRVLNRYEYKALPNGSVVLDRDGEAWQKSHIGYWRTVGDYKDRQSPTNFAPLTLVYAGEMGTDPYAGRVVPCVMCKADTQFGGLNICSKECSDALDRWIEGVWDE